MSEQTSYDCLNNFCKCVFHLYTTEYLRRPTVQDVQRLTAKRAEIHGFSGLLGSLDCMHWGWRNYLTRWKGYYTRGDHGVPTVMLEAVASYDGWFWHVVFETVGSNNDINVLNQSDLFSDLLHGEAPPCTFTVNGFTFTKGYYLTDGIYPECLPPNYCIRHNPKTNPNNQDEAGPSHIPDDEDEEDQVEDQDEDEE
ncbi:uncharacterized protein [Rutidosis leptorrhynchoides]|uniref:uncharacterized protein n=1 Tax=Rutidosis leptorrhynchoides TaxID=125765 RepID=UPI003A98F10E